MLILLSTLILSLLSLTFAQYSNSSVFIFDGDKNTQFVFALQADKYAGDLFFHLSAPSGNEWVAVGIGNQMAGSLMFIAYPDGNGDGITLSPRIADGHSEPTYSSNIQLELQAPNTGTEDQTENIFKVNGVCRSCVTWNDGQGSIDLTSSAQPFIFAVGPPFPPVRSDSKSAGLTEHIFVGHFTMNMPAATVQYGGSVPPGPYTIRYGASSATDTQQTNEPGPRIHGLIMCIVFVLLFPFGSLILRVWNKVKAHAIVQVIATILFCMAFAAGIVVSSKYNRSKHFNSAHQVIGILLLIAILSQLVLGILHHRVYKKEQRKTIRGWIHLYLGPAIIFFGLINGGLGFAFARNSFLAIPYTIIIIIVALIYACVRFFAWRRRKRNQAYNKEQARKSYQFPRFGSQQQPPPEYREGRGEWRPPYGQDVPLERYQSSEGVAHVGMPAQEPRTMI